MKKPYVSATPDTGDEGGEEGGNTGDIDSPFDENDDVFDGGWA